MASLIRRLAGSKEMERRSLQLGFQQWVEMLNFQNVLYPTGYANTLRLDREEARGDYSGLGSMAYLGNGIVFGCMYLRMRYFGEARFTFRQMRDGRPGKMFGTSALKILEEPWQNATTQDLLCAMIQDVDLGGNAYVLNQGDRLMRLRPDWVSILIGPRKPRDNFRPGDDDQEIKGYIFKQGGPSSQSLEKIYPVERVAHWAPIKDPFANYRGISWLTALIRDIQGDTLMSEHRLKFFEQGSTVNTVVTIPKETASTLEQFLEWKRVLGEGHDGIRNFHKPMYLGMGADVKAIGSDLQQNDFVSVQQAGETRIALAAGIPATLLGIGEGLQGSTLNAGNYETSRRTFADGTLRHLWRGAAGALQTIVQLPDQNSVLFYDDRDIDFLRQNEADIAEIQLKIATAASTMRRENWDPDAVINWLDSNDISVLIGKHLGGLSVQSKPGNTGGTTPNGSTNGSTSGGNPTVAA